MYSIIFKKGCAEAETLPQRLSIENPTDIHSCLAHIAAKKLAIPNVILIEAGDNVWDVYQIVGPVGKISVIPYVSRQQ